MSDVMRNLLRLQALEFNETTEKNAEAQIAKLRALIPQPIVAHYDRLATRGKKGVAVVRNQACTGCHMRLPIGTINTMMHGQDIQICDTCGRYLCLPDAVEGQVVETIAAAEPASKPASKPRKRKALARAT